MLERFENQKYIYAGIKYMMVTNISRRCDVFTLHLPFDRTKDVDYVTAINALTCIYYHFLTSGGLISRECAVAVDPSFICLNLTKDERPGGEPVLTADETEKYLGFLLHGLYKFHNKKCRNTEVVQGMAYFVRKLYEPYMSTSFRNIHELYYSIMARGTFVLQMNNKLLARALYRKMYDLLPDAVKQQKYFFGSISLDAQASYDSILIHDDIYADPMRDEVKYPWNMYRYNVDNLILTYCTAKEMKSIGGKTKCFQPEEIKRYDQTMSFIHDFFTNISAFYKVRCDHFNGRENPSLKDGDPVKYYGNVNNTMEKYSTLPMDYCPYLFYSCELFKSSDDARTWLYAGIAKTYTGREYSNLDLDCAIFGDRQRRLDQGHQFPLIMSVMSDAAVLLSGAIMILAAINEWERRTHGLTILLIGFCVFVGIMILGLIGAGAD